MRLRNTLVAALLASAAAIAAHEVLAQEKLTSEQLEQQLKEQESLNAALKDRIAKLEAVLKTDVCTNPEAEALLNAPPPAATTRTP